MRALPVSHAPGSWVGEGPHKRRTGGQIEYARCMGGMPDFNAVLAPIRRSRTLNGVSCGGGGSLIKSALNDPPRPCGCLLHGLERGVVQTSILTSIHTFLLLSSCLYLWFLQPPADTHWPWQSSQEAYTHYKHCSAGEKLLFNLYIRHIPKAAVLFFFFVLDFRFSLNGLLGYPSLERVTLNKLIPALSALIAFLNSHRD